MGDVAACKAVAATAVAILKRKLLIVRCPSFRGASEAAEAILKVLPPTPLLEIEIGDRTAFLKVESLQPVGAFKIRGAWHRLTALSKGERVRGVVAFSSGNHAQGVAWAARKLDMPAVIVMPSDAPLAKLEGTRRLGAEIVYYDRQSESREDIAAALATERGAVLVPSFDDPWIVEGQGSAGIEAIGQFAAKGLHPPDLVVTPCGGGGLAAGLALACPDARIVVVEPEGWDDMGCSLRLGHIVPVSADAPPTACDALQTRKVAPLTFDILANRHATGVSVSELQIEDAIRYAFSNLQLVLEPGGAVALAALLCGNIPTSRNTLIILSGGNIDADLFAAILSR